MTSTPSVASSHPNISPRSRLFNSNVTWLPFATFGIFLLATAWTLGKPGLPASLRADEAAYLTLASSLVEDGDIAVEYADLDRIFRIFPYTGALHFPVRFKGDELPAVDRPLLYPLLIAPWVALVGANGPLLFNGLLALLTSLLILYHLRGPDKPPPLLCFAFLGLSAVFPYIFWIHPTLLWVSLGALAVVGLGESRWAGINGGAVALLIGQVPAVALLLPAILWRQIDSRQILRWLVGTALGAALALGLAHTEARLPNAGDVTRATAVLENPEQIDQLSLLRNGDPAAKLAPASMGDMEASIPRTLYYSLFERRTGLLAYFPLILLVIASFFTDRGPRPPWQWLLLAGAAGGSIWLTAAPLPQVGGELLGDPAKAALYPAFLLLIRRLPPWPVSVGAMALATLTLGAALVTSIGPAMAYGDRQSYSRGGLIQHLPLSIEHIGAGGVYFAMPLEGEEELDARLWAPDFASELHEPEIWLLGNESVELFLETAMPLEGVTTSWRIRNFAAGNIVHGQFGEHRERYAFPDELPASGQGAKVEVDLGAATEISTSRGLRFVYPINISSEKGTKPGWHPGPPGGTYYVGAALTFFGRKDHLERDLFDAEALGCGVPPAVVTGEEFKVIARVANRSSETWNSKGAARVRFGQRWRKPDGSAVEGKRADFEGKIEPGAEASAWLDTRAPLVPGIHQLEIDLVHENVAWFAGRRADGEPLCRLEVNVVPAPAGEEVKNADP